MCWLYRPYSVFNSARADRRPIILGQLPAALHVQCRSLWPQSPACRAPLLGIQGALALPVRFLQFRSTGARCQQRERRPVPAATSDAQEAALPLVARSVGPSRCALGPRWRTSKATSRCTTPRASGRGRRPSQPRPIPCRALAPRSPRHTPRSSRAPLGAFRRAELGRCGSLGGFRTVRRGM